MKRLFSLKKKKNRYTVPSYTICKFILPTESFFIYNRLILLPLISCYCFVQLLCVPFFHILFDCHSYKNKNHGF